MDRESDAAAARADAARERAQLVEGEAQYAAANGLTQGLLSMAAFGDMNTLQKLGGALDIVNNARTLGATSATSATSATGATGAPDTGQADSTEFTDQGNSDQGNSATLATATTCVNLAQGIDSLQHWDDLNGLQRASGVVGVIGGVNAIGGGFLGDSSAFAEYSGYLGMAQAIDSGNYVGAIASYNALSGGAVDAAANSALGTTGVPYVGVALALSNLEEHPGQAIGSLVGMCWGPVGSFVGGMVGGMLDQAGVFGDGPPPPAGHAGYIWDAQGHLQIQVDHDQSGGGEMARQTAQGVADLLNRMVETINAQNPDPADDVAINPYLLPRVGINEEGPWLEFTTPDGRVARQSLNTPDLAELLLNQLADNGGIAPAWMGQTQQGHFNTLITQGADGARIAAKLGAGAGGQAYYGNAAYALQGGAAESADYKSQSHGALVLTLADPKVAAGVDELRQQAIATGEALRDVEGDGYYERTEWLSATDAAGNAQGLLVLDFDNNGRIETRDILNLGGNAGQDGNVSDQARQASELAHLQRNVRWMVAEPKFIWHNAANSDHWRLAA